MKKKQVDLCVSCGSKMNSVILSQYERRRKGERLVIFEDVPCRECPKCGQRYFDAATGEMMEAVLEGRLSPTGKTEVPTFSLQRRAA